MERLIDQPKNAPRAALAPPRGLDGSLDDLLLPHLGEGALVQAPPAPGMMESNSTLGPWVAQNGGPFIVTLKGTVIAKVGGNKSDPINWQCEPADLENIANSYILAASQDMYDVLQDVSKDLECTCGGKCRGRCSLARVNAVLAKADGR